MLILSSLFIPDSELSTSRLKQQIGMLDQMLLKYINNWRQASDAVYLLHPIDGSLFIW